MAGPGRGWIGRAPLLGGLKKGKWESDVRKMKKEDKREEKERERKKEMKKKKHYHDIYKGCVNFKK